MMGNAGASKLTGYPHLELINLKLELLFPGMMKKDLAEKLDETRQIEQENPLIQVNTVGQVNLTDQARPADQVNLSHQENSEGQARMTYALDDLALARRDRSSGEVFVTLNILDPEEKWALLILEDSHSHKARLSCEEKLAATWEELRILASVPQAVESPDAIQSALQAGSLLLGASLLAIYLAGGKEYELTRRAVYGTAEKLPERLHPNDLYSLRTPYLWQPKKRALSGLHRAGRTSGFAYLVSAPLGQPNALVGLLAVAVEQGTPEENTLRLVEILAATITTILQNQSLSSTLQTKLRQRQCDTVMNTAVKDNIQEGIVILSPTLSIEELNPSAEAILGYASREVRGQPYQNLLVGAENLIPAFIGSQPGFTTHDLGNINLYRRDGKSFLAHVRILPLLVNEVLECLVVLIQDLSQEEEYRLRNQQLEQRALLGELTASFAHEIRNPINNISTGLQLMELNLPPDDASHEIISRLRQDCDRLDNLMKSVLTFSRPMEYKMEPLDLGQALQRLLERWHHRLVRANIKYNTQIDPNTPKVEGDQRALEQVWSNLIGNAIQAMEDTGGTLTVKLRPVIAMDNTPRVEVSISDTGTGIPDEYRERIFEPFFTTKRNGTGLGLAITKRIITTHKGTIQVTSIPGGTAFQVQLPVLNLTTDRK